MVPLWGWGFFSLCGQGQTLKTLGCWISIQSTVYKAQKQQFVVINDLREEKDEKEA